MKATVSNIREIIISQRGSCHGILLIIS